MSDIEKAGLQFTDVEQIPQVRRSEQLLPALLLYLLMLFSLLLL